MIAPRLAHFDNHRAVRIRLEYGTRETCAIDELPAIMTKSREGGENYITKAAKREAKRSGKDVCSILGKWLTEAKQAGDVRRAVDILMAQKYLGCRNKRKRSST
ncbi:MAG TPA: hypothetical protein VNH11_11390 [Pirellulales bacterium]|nr:hypothetical protein [Pirellulales bacterium]